MTILTESASAAAKTGVKIACAILGCTDNMQRGGFP